jgi:uncharacterized protein (TIGR02453 family)
MAHLNKAAWQFLSDLAANNNREWFHENKKKFETIVKQPFEEIITEVIERISDQDPALATTAKESIFRIYKDTRFSNDKRPYKEHVSAHLSSFGKQAPIVDGLYIHLSASENSFVAAGAYMPDKFQLKAIRDAIIAEPERVESILSNPELKKVYGELEGEKNKILPQPYKDYAAQYPILWHKQYLLSYATSNAEDLFLKEDIVDRLVYYYEVARPWSLFLRDALRS